MIITSGKGYLVPLTWVASSALFGLGFNLKGADNAVAAIMLSATVCTLLAKRWKQKEKERQQTEIDYVPKKVKHSFFFIPMEHIWLPALLLIAAITAIMAYYGKLHF